MKKQHESIFKLLLEGGAGSTVNVYGFAYDNNYLYIMLIWLTLAENSFENLSIGLVGLVISLYKNYYNNGRGFAPKLV